jgi:hypothetical protein
MPREPERKLVWSIPAIACALLLVAPPAATVAAGRVLPMAGTYRGTVKRAAPHNRGAGCFAAKPTVFGKRVKPADGDGTRCRDEIIAPSLGPIVGVKKGCTAKPAVLDTGGFPIQRAAFHYTGAARIGPHGRSLTVDFRGRWVTRTKVVGTTRVSGGGCVSEASWAMATPAT